MRLWALAPLSLALGGCSLLFPEDPRLGYEAYDDCLSRVSGELLEFRKAASESDGLLVPTYTYDITKVGFEAKRALIVEGSDETLGARLKRETNRVRTAYQRFNTSPTDETGVFFLGNDPALYRVRGGAQFADTILPTGCARQMTDARLVRVDIEPFQRATRAAPSTETPDGEPLNETTN